jgi:hypothetical protein
MSTLPLRPPDPARPGAAHHAPVPTGCDPDDPDAVTRVLIRPVFLAVGDRRRRLLVRSGYGTAAVCLTYLAMIGFSLTSAPPGRPAALAPATPRPHAAAAAGSLRRSPVSAPPPARASAAVLAEEALEFARVNRAARIPDPPDTTPAPVHLRPPTTSGAPFRGDRDDKPKPSAKASPTSTTVPNSRH